MSDIEAFHQIFTHANTHTNMRRQAYACISACVCEIIER